MASWIGVITNAGAALLAEWVQGQTLSIDSAEAGSGTYAEATLMGRTALAEYKQAASIVSKTKITNGYKVKLQITAPASGYTLNQFGLKASVGGGSPALLAIFQNADGIAIPSVSAAPDFVYSFYAILPIGNENDMQVTVDTSALVSQSTLNSAIATRIAASGGDAADAIIGSSTASTALYPVPAVNDTFKVILGKIIKFCADIVKTFTGAASGTAGAKGLVPAPASGEQNKYLRGDATWQAPVNDALATTAGGVLDARMGKTLQDQITSLNDSLAFIGKIYSDYQSTSVQANSWQTGASVTVPAGTYLLIYRAHSNSGVIRIGNSSNGGAWSQSSAASSTAEFIIAMTVDIQTIFSAYLFCGQAGTYGNGVIAIRFK